MPTTSQPELPDPAHGELDSMLSRKFGREVANYFSGSPLNRVSFLRSEPAFLTAAFTHPTSRFLLFRNLHPLLSNPSTLIYSRREVITPLVGDNPFSKSESEMIEQYNSSQTVPQMIFLGLDEREKRTDGSGEEDGEGLTWKEVYKGRPVWAVDVTPNGTVKDAAEKLGKEMEDKGWEFHPGRMPMGLPAADAAVYAQARALLDWNARNPFCAACGQPTLSVHAGGKRVCPPKDMASLPAGAIGSTTASSPTERPSCVTRTGISNLSFPRTDPTVIMAVVSADGQRVMLGRQKRWPQYFYSTLAGFCEPAESIEEAVRREVWEEAGVQVGRVVIHSTQPWPFPANLMIGAIGQTLPNPASEKIDLGNDPELDDAKWYTFDEVREALRVGTSQLGEEAGPEYVEGNLRLPPRTAIANQLIEAVVGGFVGGGPGGKL